MLIGVGGAGDIDTAGNSLALILLQVIELDLSDV